MRTGGAIPFTNKGTARDREIYDGGMALNGESLTGRVPPTETSSGWVGGREINSNSSRSRRVVSQISKMSLFAEIEFSVVNQLWPYPPRNLRISLFFLNAAGNFDFENACMAPSQKRPIEKESFEL